MRWKHEAAPLFNKSNYHQLSSNDQIDIPDNSFTCVHRNGFPCEKTLQVGSCSCECFTNGGYSCECGWLGEDRVSDICSCMHHEFRLTSPWKTVKEAEDWVIVILKPHLKGRDGRAKGSYGEVGPACLLWIACPQISQRKRETTCQIEFGVNLMKFIRHTSEQSNWLIPVIVGQTRISNRAMPLPSKWQRRFGLFLGFSIDVLGMAKKLYEQLFEFQSLLPMRVAGETGKLPLRKCSKNIQSSCILPSERAIGFYRM